MVRLKLDYKYEQYIILDKFQFLNGAIKIQFVLYLLNRLAIFQFLNGAIKIILESGSSNYFYAFQFLNGAIKMRKQFGWHCLKFISIPQWCD